MSDEYEEGLRNAVTLAEFYNKKRAQRNEASTRLQLIDRLFFECLGWTRDDVTVEESQNGSYADYTFLAPRKILILEAKKEGISFEFPATQHAKPKRSLRTLLGLGEDLKGAIEQVTR